MSLLEQDTTTKRQMDEEVGQMEFDAGDNKSGEYKVDAIWDNAIYARESESGHLPGLYYLFSWKGYLEEKNTWEPASAVQHLRKLISSFHKHHPDKPTATFPAIDIASPMARLTVKPTETPKQKRGRPANSINKRPKKNWAALDFYRVFGQIWVSYTLDILSCTTCDCMWLHVTTHDFQLTFIKISTLRFSSLIPELTSSTL